MYSVFYELKTATMEMALAPIEAAAADIAACESVFLLECSRLPNRFHLRHSMHSWIKPGRWLGNWLKRAVSQRSAKPV